MRCFFIPPIVALLTSVAVAQPLFTTVETLEWMAADSPVIVRGVVLNFERKVDETGNNLFRDTVVIKVRETLKGQHKPFRTLRIDNWSLGTDLHRWKKSQHELLVFLTDRFKGKKLNHNQLAPRNFCYERSAMIELTVKEKLPSLENKSRLRKWYTLDLKDLRARKEILKRTRVAIADARKIKCLRAHKVHWPKSSAGNIIRIVPAGSQLEREARRWVQSDKPRLREEGAKALGLFPSKKNVTVLKKLLEDPAYKYQFKQVGNRYIKTGREFFVRRAAFASLKKHGIKVPEPVFHVPMPKK